MGHRRKQPLIGSHTPAAHLRRIIEASASGLLALSIFAGFARDARSADLLSDFWTTTYHTNVETGGSRAQPASDDSYTRKAGVTSDEPHPFRSVCGEVVWEAGLVDGHGA